MRSLLLLIIPFILGANPATLLDDGSGFYKNASGLMLPLYENNTCKNDDILNYLPIGAVCIIALERYKDGKALIEYKGQRGWVDTKKHPDHIVLMHHNEMQLPMVSMCSQVGPYFFEIKSMTEGKAVNIYEKPSTKSKVITTLIDHESCLVNLGCEWPWCRIDTGGHTGWVLSINLTDQIEHVEGYCLPREHHIDFTN